MPAESHSQATAARIAKHDPERLYARNRGLLQMEPRNLNELARTKSRGLPRHVKPRKPTR